MGMTISMRSGPQCDLPAKSGLNRLKGLSDTLIGRSHCGPLLYVTPTFAHALSAIWRPAVTSNPRSQCDACARHVSPWEPPGDAFGAGVPFCAAFPDGIPDLILHNGFDYRQPFEGDHGLQWTPGPGEEFAEYAFLPESLGR